MSDTTLYRKYRPQKWSDVVGQEILVELLQKSIKEDRIAHAYIFAGGRGIGKTSVARIFAREIGTTDDDIYEIDAASNRGIDDIRALRETIETLPFSSPQKVYIIDEAHMLTREAWNALLKTLEEPPKHVIFILATTELEKFPDTIQSRCQIVEFRKPSDEILSKIIAKIAKKEEYEIEQEAAELIALMANGSFRDAEGALQKVMSFISGKKITLEAAEKSLGAPKESLVEAFLEAVGKKDVEAGLGALAKAKEADMNIELFGRLALQKMRDIVLLKYSKSHKEVIEKRYSADRFKFLLETTTGDGMTWNAAVLQKMLRTVMEAERSIAPELNLELFIINALVE